MGKSFYNDDVKPVIQWYYNFKYICVNRNSRNILIVTFCNHNILDLTINVNVNCKDFQRDLNAVRQLLSGWKVLPWVKREEFPIFFHFIRLRLVVFKDIATAELDCLNRDLPCLFSLGANYSVILVLVKNLQFAEADVISYGVAGNAIQPHGFCKRAPFLA